MSNFKFEGLEFKPNDYWNYLEEYNKLVEECDKNGHLEPNKNKNVCEHCFRDLKEKLSQIEKELIADSKRNSKLDTMYRSLNFGEILRISKREKALEEFRNFYTGYDRYVASLKK